MAKEMWKEGMEKDYIQTQLFRQGKKEGKREILDKLRKLLAGDYSKTGAYPSEILVDFIEDNTPPKGGE